MRRELLAIGLISLALFMLGNICTGLVMEAGNAQLDLAYAFINRLSQARVLYAEPLPLSIGAACACAVWLVWVRWWERRGSYRKGEEHGSARWATANEMVAFSDKGNPDNNIILTASARKRLEDTAHDQRTETNNNVLVIGGPGTGKTRYYVKPNLMQANASFFITDPKGTLIHDMGWVLEWLGYEIKTFDTVDFSRSMHFNPIAYIKDEAGLLRFVECLIKNTTAEGESATDPFWVNAEKLLYTALVAYLLDHCPEEDRNIPGLLSLLALADAREDDEGYLSPLDMLFKELETGRRLMKVSEGRAFDPSSRAFTTDTGDWAWVKVAEPVRPEDDFALSSYKQFKVAAGKTLKSIMISCNVRMKPFDIAEMRELLRFDEMTLDHMGDANAKVAIFASMSDTDSTFDFVFALLMQQALDTLCDCALRRFAGRLPRCVHFVFDEFANIGELPNFEQTISTVRSRNISCSVIVQSFAQLEKRYREGAEIIKDNCDTTLFLGGKAVKTNKEISEAIGKETVSAMTVNDSRGQGSSTTRNRQIIERDLMQASEVGRLPRDEAIVLIAGANPIRDKKYRLEGHPRYGMLAKGR